MASRLWVAAALALGLSAGSAVAESRVYDLPAFQSVSVSSGVAAIVKAGGSQSVRAEAANTAILNRLEVNVKGTRLEIGMRWDFFDFLFSFGQHRDITVYIDAPAISAVEASSGADVDVEGMKGDGLSLGASSGASLVAKGVAGATISAETSSGAHIEATGTCTSLAAEASSGASLSARGLACADATAEASSGAHIDAFASARVKAEASSGASITIYGKPTGVETQSSSGGSVNIAP